MKTAKNQHRCGWMELSNFVDEEKDICRKRCCEEAEAEGYYCGRSL